MRSAPAWQPWMLSSPASITRPSAWCARLGTMPRPRVAWAGAKMKPELVLVRAGFDAHARDPIGSLGLQTEDFATLTRHTLEIASTHSNGRLIACLEGGYNLDALAESVQVHLEELLRFR